MELQRKRLKPEHGAGLSPWSEAVIAVGGGHLDKLMDEVWTKDEDNCDFTGAY